MSAIRLRVPAPKNAVWLTQTGGNVALGTLFGLRGGWLPSSAVAWSVLFVVSLSYGPPTNLASCLNVLGWYGGAEWLPAVPAELYVVARRV